MADRVTHLAHLAVAPFPHCDLEQGVAVAFAAARAQGCRVILYGPRGPIFFTAPGAPPPGALAVAFAPARAQGCRPRGRAREVTFERAGLVSVGVGAHSL